MALPTQYLTSSKNLEKIFDTIQGAQAPDKFTVKWLEQQGFTSSADRLVVGILKSLGFIDSTGKPLQRYFDYLDQTQGKRVLAEAIREAYSDLFKLNKNAQTMTKTDLKNKLKTLTEGQLTDAVLDKMVTTFQNLVKRADFSALPTALSEVDKSEETKTQRKPESDKPSPGPRQRSLADLVYNIQIHLPESRDATVYDAIFRSLKEHLL